MRHCLIGLFAVMALATAGCEEDEGTDMAVKDLSVSGGDLTAARDLANADLGGGAADMTSTTPMSAAVAVMDNFFAPNNVTIAAGGTVTWTWGGSNPHTVTSGTGTPSGMFDSSPSKTSGTFSFTFPTAGTFPYYCTVHGAAVMSGTVTVK